MNNKGAGKAEYTERSLFVFGSAAEEGAARLAVKYQETLCERIPAWIVAEAANRLGAKRTEEAAKAAEPVQDTYIFEAGEGGIFDALNRMAKKLECGFTVTLRSIPILQETVEISEVFGINPYEGFSDGMILIATSGGEELQKRFHNAGLPVFLIGKTERGRDKIVLGSGVTTYLSPVREDPLIALLQEGSNDQHSAS